MLHCVLLAAVISCTGTAPKMTPAEVATLLAPHQFVAIPEQQNPDQIVVIASSVTAGPYGEFPAPRPSVRLDGTPLWLPPTVYGDVRRHSVARQSDRRVTRPALRTDRPRR